MTTYIKDEIIEKVKDNIDIVNIISNYIQLKRSGSNYLGLCPFHNEKTPSFTVSETKQIFHCFGCGEGGDGVTFIMKKENLDFPEAVKFLADKMGIEVEEEQEDNKKYLDERNKTFEINKEAARFFYNTLIDNNLALDYLKKRMISNKIIRQFGLGFSIDSWDNLYKYLIKKEYTAEEIERSGLIGKKNGNNGYYDKFRNRIMFPIIDTKARIIGFGGRVLDDSKPKYLNSQDTIVFNKGNHLYGLNLLNKFSDRKRILLVEGYMDVISIFSSGINYSVASLGTALSEKQGKLIKRYGEEVYICYDSDSAGIKATLKAIDILLKVGVSPRVISLPNGMDPDDYLKRYGQLEFEKLFTASYNYFDYKVYINKRKYNLENLEEKIKFTVEVAGIIKELKSPIEQDGYIDKISIETGISREAIENEVKGKNKVIAKQNHLFDHNKNINYNIKPMLTILPNAQIKAEMDLIKFMILDKDYFDFISNKLSIDNFESMECKHIFSLLSLNYKNEEEINEKVLISNILEIPKIDQIRVQSIFDNVLKFQPTNINQIIDDLIKTVLISNLHKKRKILLTKIEDLEKKERNEIEEAIFNKLCLDLIALNKDISLNN